MKFIGVILGLAALYLLALALFAGSDSDEEIIFLKLIPGALAVCCIIGCVLVFVIPLP